jgi:hypothetical protein
VFADQGGVATSPQILEHLTRRAMQRCLRTGQLARIWPGLYSLGSTDTLTKMRGLDLRCGQPVAACLSTAAALYGFDTENVAALHVLNPSGNLLRDREGLVVHRRDGAPLMTFRGRPVTAPAWTAIEVARGLRRPRVLATLDAALRSGTCERQDLVEASLQHAGRRGIVKVRELIPFARPGAESPMESEARLAMLDGGLPEPVLQYQVVDLVGQLWRLDFAWPEYMVAAEYDGFDWHSSPEHLRRDRRKRAALEELGWRTHYLTSDDVRRRPVDMVRRIDARLHVTAA